MLSRKINFIEHLKYSRRQFSTMKIFGIDFTSRPSKSKPLTCLECDFDGSTLSAGNMIEWNTFGGFEEFLDSEGEWIAGIDFPFGLPRKFIENIGWPTSWETYVDYAGSLERSKFREILDTYKEHRPKGDKEHLRLTDAAAGSISPQKQYGVPVSLMFYEGAPRLLKSGVSVPGLFKGSSTRNVVEAYPGVIAKRLIPKRVYKQDAPNKQTIGQLETRKDLLGKIINGDCIEDYGFVIEASFDLCNDPSGDQLDALLCAMQAAWAWSNREDSFGAPGNLDLLEGWIVDPIVCRKMKK
jgi:hypothetical protein